MIWRCFPPIRCDPSKRLVPSSISIVCEIIHLTYYRPSKHTSSQQILTGLSYVLALGRLLDDVMIRWGSTSTSFGGCVRKPDQTAVFSSIIYLSLGKMWNELSSFSDVGKNKYPKQFSLVPPPAREVSWGSEWPCRHYLKHCPTVSTLPSTQPPHLPPPPPAANRPAGRVPSPPTLSASSKTDFPPPLAASALQPPPRPSLPRPPAQLFSAGRMLFFSCEP